MSRHSARGRAWTRLRTLVLATEPNCWICGQPIDHTLPGTHPQGPTVDHIHPTAQGGPPLTRSNLRAAHATCNMQRHHRVKPTHLGTNSRPW